MTALRHAPPTLLGRWWFGIDRWILAALIALVFFGVLLTLAASPASAIRLGIDRLHFVRLQLVFMPVALAIMLATSMLSVANVRRVGVLAFLVCLALTVATLLVGPEINGARRWLPLPGLSLQPAEFLKPAFAVFAAWLIAGHRLQTGVPGNVIVAGAAIAVIGLLAMQPDIGNAVLIAAIALAQFFLAGLSVFWIILLGLAGLGGLLLAWLLFDHVAARVNAFLDPATGDNYQINTALDAFAAGGLFGRGPGEGTVKELLPDAHSDFIFAVAGEEFGLITCLLIVGLFAFIVLRGLGRMLEENDLFVLLAVGGLLTAFGVQAMINLASTLHMVPTKGITLPFISYGGSSLLGMAFAMGMVLALTRRAPWSEAGR